MVGWFDPPQLVSTGRQVLVSTLFAAHADNRLIESITWGPNRRFDYSKQNEIWIDYTADVGDGFDSTYAVAYWLTRPNIGDTQRGKVLVFGGDEVYPTASRVEYERRLKAPYEAADPPAGREPDRDLFAIPGNHDWYDSLVSFSRLFGGHRHFANWRAPQCRSYFALELPHRWWLIGTDIQLNADIDAPQLNYFKKIAKRMSADDRVILCNAEPFWIQRHIYGDLAPHRYPERTNLDLLMENEELFRGRVRVVIAGDSHHYRHHATGDGLHKIVAGGGGAFLHLTNGADVSELESGAKLIKAWPDEEESRKLARRNLLFPLINPKLGFFFTGPLYAWVGLAVASTINPLEPVRQASLGLLNLPAWIAISVVLHLALMLDRGKRQHKGAHGVLHLLAIAATFAAFAKSAWPLPQFTTPATFLFWSAIIVLLLVLFTDTHSKPYRLIGGTIHGLMHVAMLAGAIGVACAIGLTPFVGLTRFLGYLAMTYLTGALVAPFVLGVYLLVSLNCFDRHNDEASSALRIADWKNFLRMHIDADGALTIFPFGIGRVPRRWRRDGATLRPDDPKSTEPNLIEPPIVIR
jgi:hypothetical protein